MAEPSYAPFLRAVVRVWHSTAVSRRLTSPTSSDTTNGAPGAAARWTRGRAAPGGSTRPNTRPRRRRLPATGASLTGGVAQLPRARRFSARVWKLFRVVLSAVALWGSVGRRRLVASRSWEVSVETSVTWRTVLRQARQRSAVVPRGGHMDWMHLMSICSSKRPVSGAPRPSCLRDQRTVAALIATCKTLAAQRRTPTGFWVCVVPTRFNTDIKYPSPSLCRPTRLVPSATAAIDRWPCQVRASRRACRCAGTGSGSGTCLFRMGQHLVRLTGHMNPPPYSTCRRTSSHDSTGDTRR